MNELINLNHLKLSLIKFFLFYKSIKIENFRPCSIEHYIQFANSKGSYISKYDWSISSILDIDYKIANCSELKTVELILSKNQSIIAYSVNNDYFIKNFYSNFDKTGWSFYAME